MRVFVTGAGGFVGSHLIHHLNEVGDRVVGLVRRSANLSCPAVVGDLHDEATIAAHLREVEPDAIIHLAGYADAGGSFLEPAAAWRGNLDATLSLYRAIESWGGRPRVLFVSSGTVYGPGGTDEGCALRPANPYAASKAAADLASYQHFCHPGLPIIRVRPFNQIGPGQSTRYAVAAFSEQIARIKLGIISPIVETGRLDVSRDFTDVRDIVVAYRLLLEHGEPGGAYNAASGTSVTIRSVLDELLRIAGVSAEVRSAPSRMRPGDVDHVNVSAQKLHRATGWKPNRTLEQSLQDILNTWRDQLEYQATITK
jgi:GDP-4-dehydro-6-deoxy-D-mannose reductase